MFISRTQKIFLFCTVPVIEIKIKKKNTSFKIFLIVFFSSFQENLLLFLLFFNKIKLLFLLSILFLFIYFYFNYNSFVSGVAKVALMHGNCNKMIGNEKMGTLMNQKGCVEKVH